MILQRYRDNIIAYDIRSGQSSYTPLWLVVSLGTAVGINWHASVGCVGSYSVGCLRSYTLTGYLGSYILEAVGGSPAAALLSVLFLSLIADTQTKLGDIDPDGSTIEDNLTDVDSWISSIADRVYGYVRQSQTDGDESASIESQKQEASRAAKNEGYSDPVFFVDKNQSGYTFEREGFQNLINALEREPRPVVLDRIDRLGRDTLETVYIAAKIHYDYDVPIITAEHGHYELDKIEEQLDLVLNAIIAGKSVENRIRAAWNSIRLRFSDDRKWKTWFNNVPVGYQSDNEEWIEPAPHATEVITATINDLLETETRTETIAKLKSAGKNELVGDKQSRDSGDKITLGEIEAEKIQEVFDRSDYTLTEFDSSRLKRLLTNPLLTGEVRYPRSKPYEEQTAIEDPTLQIVDQELFDEVNEFLEQEEKKYSTDAEDSITVDGLADYGMLLLAIDVVDAIKPVCPQCNRGMVRNGEDTNHPLEDGRIAHYWICPKYKEEGAEADCQRKVPYKNEWEAIQNDLEEAYTDRSDIVLLKVCPPKD
nr:recombinase family protein [Haloplanus ruber]